WDNVPVGGRVGSTSPLRSLSRRRRRRSCRNLQDLWAPLLDSAIWAAPGKPIAPSRSSLFPLHGRAVLFSPQEKGGQGGFLARSQAKHEPLYIKERPSSSTSSASRTLSLAVNSAWIAVLWIFILVPPIPRAPQVRTCPREVPLSVASTPSMPRGGTALRSMSAVRLDRLRQTEAGRSETPAAPAAMTTEWPCKASARSSAVVGAKGVIGPPMVWRRDSASSVAR